MPTKTYKPIATTTLSSSVASYTFSSIPSNYTDLILAMSASITTAGNTIRIQFNGDTAGNYSYTALGATSGGPLGTRGSNTIFLPFWVFNGAAANQISANVVNINNYSNTTTFKTSIIRANYGDNGEATGLIGLWRSTAAISSISIFSSAGNLGSGSQFTLYGIQ